MKKLLVIGMLSLMLVTLLSFQVSAKYVWDPCVNKGSQQTCVGGYVWVKDPKPSCYSGPLGSKYAACSQKCWSTWGNEEFFFLGYPACQSYCNIAYC